MVLEATMIVVDNSESSRNGDYLPSRFGAQSDAVNMIFNAKTNANPESSVGLMSMGGKTPEVLVTLTTDIGKVLDGLHRTKIWGKGHLSTGIQVAGLALKHRQNKSQRQRIIVFTCSPIADEEKSLVTLARRMKKNAISIDFIAFGDLESETKSKLEAFNEHVKGGDGSHLVFVPPGPNQLSDVLLTSPILAGEGAGGGGSGGGAGGENGIPGGADAATAGGGAAAAAGGIGFEFGIDPSVDPEMAMALRMSMEEETNRLERQRREREEAEQKEKEKQDKDKERLEGIPEEGQGQGGQSSGAGAAAGDESSGQGGEGKTKNTLEEGDTKDEQDGGGEGGGGGSANADADADKMDTA